MKKRMITIAAVITILAAAGAVFIYWYSSGTGLFAGEGQLTFVSSGTAVEFDPNSGASFYAPGSDGYFFVTKDGARYMTTDGRTHMAESFTMQNPVLLGEGHIIGMADASGYDCYVFNTDDIMYQKHFQNPIVNFAVNSKGYSCVVTQTEDGYESFVHNEYGSVIQYRMDNTGQIILSTDISDDGRIWAISYLDGSGAQINSFLTYAYLNDDEAAGYSDNIFATLRGENTPELNNEYFGMIRFLDGNNLVVVSDKSVFCVGPESMTKPKWQEKLGNSLDSVAFYGNYVCLGFGREMLGTGGEPSGRIVLLNAEGLRVFYYDLNRDITNIQMNPTGIIAGSERIFTAFDLKGRLLWEYEGQFDSRSMYIMDEYDDVLLQTGTDASLMRLTRISGQGSGSEDKIPAEESSLTETSSENLSTEEVSTGIY